MPQPCVILTPVSNNIEPAVDDALKELEKRGYPVWRVRGYSAIDQGRNQLATDAMEQGFDETWNRCSMRSSSNMVIAQRRFLPMEATILGKM